ncbi:hypothetical protein EST38_g4657 [Candolleomyces aberdarensis]|uniref:Transposase domain-containing protein n=1 Tax=Candolleomyces aberdarensis TaxID=2316362 RepID=A0A4Q2DMH0_9AGAR|nr:hypothetical protein EST38_g4657 [Candolleomyces aberdarensis]
MEPPRTRATQRPTSKAKTKAPGETLPNGLLLCQCPDCVLHPGSHPLTGLPCSGESQGCWTTPVEYDRHQKIQRSRAAANIVFPSLSEHPEVPAPSDATIVLSQPATPDSPEIPPSTVSQSFEWERPPSLSTNAFPPSNLGEDHQSLIKELETVRSELQEARNVVGDDVLYFQHPPSLDCVVRTSKMEEKELDELCSLTSMAPSNSPVIAYQGVLARTKIFARQHLHHAQVPVRLQAKLTFKRVEEQQTALRQLLLHEWRRQRQALEESNFFDTVEYFISPVRTLPTSVLAIYLLVSTLHLLSGLSYDDCSFTLRTLRLVFGLLLLQSTSIHAASVHKAIHTDIRMVIKILDVQPRFKAMLTCPECSWVHEVDPDVPPNSPAFCQNIVFEESCGAPLTKKRRAGDQDQITVPIRQYIYQPMREYLACLFSRPDLAMYLDRNPTVSGGKDSNDMRDIWDGSGLKKLKGPDGKPFLLKGTGESRLVFSLNMDGFNPWGNKEAGKKVSVGAIYMVCLNLPPSLRYELENMFLVGVIPGPHGPSNHEINYFLKPLVDDMLQLWEEGVYLSRTVGCPHGRRVRCTLGPLVCDLPAACQMSRFGHYRSRLFCSECDCTMDQINDSLKKVWNPRTLKTHLFAATRWKEAKSVEEREQTTQQYGVRWSELLRLPYWDPIHFTVIDSMHAFYLRLFQHHCRSVWGMDVDFEDGVGVTYDIRSNQPTEDEMKIAEHILRHGTREMLSGLSRHVLRELCRQTSSLPFNRNKRVLLEQLLHYCVEQKWFTSEGVHLGSVEEADMNQSDTLSEGTSNVFPDPQAIEKFWLSASKTKLRQLVKDDLLILVKAKALPSLSMTEGQLEKLKNAELKAILEEKARCFHLSHIPPAYLS